MPIPTQPKPTAAYLREMEHARRDLGELVALVAGPADLTLRELMQAIGLATMAHDALIAAFEEADDEVSGKPVGWQRVRGAS